MTNEELQQLVEDVSLKSFNRPFRHEATFNNRLRTTGGRYHLSDHRLDFNPRVFEIYGLEELVGVIKHELCHYHLHLEKKGYQHKDQDFKRLLKETGGSRFVRPLQKRSDKKYHYYECLKCHGTIIRARRINTEKYVCQCGGKLKNMVR